MHSHTRTHKRKSQKAQTRRKQRGGKTRIHSSAAFVDLLVYLREFTLEVPFEVCGTIVKERMAYTNATGRVRNEYVAYLHDLTPPLNNGSRPQCIFEHTKDPIIWHNHPKTSKFYPSMEDIVKGLKPKNQHISESYIFCEYGIWKIQYWDHNGVTKEEMKQVTNALNQLYYTADRGRVYNRKTDPNVDQMIKTIHAIFPSRLTIRFLGTPY